MVVLEQHVEALLIDSDDRCFVSQTCFHFVCSACAVLRKTEETNNMRILAYIVSLFYHLSDI